MYGCKDLPIALMNASKQAKIAFHQKEYIKCTIDANNFLAEGNNYATYRIDIYDDMTACQDYHERMIEKLINKKR